MNVQCSHVHIAVSVPCAPPVPGIGGSGEAPGPTNEVCLDVGGEGPFENDTTGLVKFLNRINSDLFFFYDSTVYFITSKLRGNTNRITQGNVE